MASSSEKLQELRALVAALPSGPRLVAALEGEAHGSSAIAALVVDIMKEAKGLSVDGAGTAAARLSFADALAVINQLMFLTPRGKQDLAFFPQHLIIKTAKTDIVVPYAAIQHIAILDQIPKDTKGRVLLFLHLSKDAKVMSGKSALHAVVIQLSDSQQLSVAHPGGGQGEKLEGLAAVVLCQAFGAVGLPPTSFCSPDPAHFTASDGGAGVEAYVKARQGHLFPLPAGLCFLESPALFIPRASIRSVELARAGGTSSTFDLYVHCTDGSTHEFSNMAKSEVGPVEGYVRSAGLRMGPAVSSDEEGSDGEGGSEHGGDSESDSEDEDFDPDEGGSSDKEAFAARRKRKRGSPNDGVSPAGGEEPLTKGSDEGSCSEGESEDSDEEESSDDDGSVELVSEDEFSMGQLRSMIDVEKQEQGKNSGKKRARHPQQGEQE